MSSNTLPNQSQTPVKKTTLSASDAFSLAEIEKAVKSIRYGTIQVIVQDGRVVQIDKTEKIRLT